MSGIEPLVLAVDDDLPIQRLVKRELEDQGLRVMTVATGAEALAAVAEQRPELVVLDLGLPDVPGLDVLAQIRERTDVPVIILTGQTATDDRIRGLDLGADDYVVKPFNPDELAARVRAVLRRQTAAQASGGPTVKSGAFAVDLERRLVTNGDDVVTLTRTEWSLLQFLAENPGKVMLSRQILSHVWGPEYVDDVQYLRVWISRIRSKLAPELIQTFPGIGYMFASDAERDLAAAASD